MTTALDIEKIICHRCYTVLDAGDSFCRHCGAATGNRGVSSPGPIKFAPDQAGEPSKWTENRWAVLVLLFLVLGPLALPLLWRSRQFSPVWKAILTTLVLGLTVWILWWIQHDLQRSLAPLKEFRRMKGF